MDKNKIEIIEGGITAPSGFLASGVNCQIKIGRMKKDLALVYSKSMPSAAGVFTTNKVKAAPVLLTQELIASGNIQGLVINSANANACTGEKGLQDARKMGRIAAHALGLKEEDVGVFSTGVIGMPLPMERVEQGICEAAEILSVEGHKDAAEAIMTTDTRIKECAVQINVAGSTVRIGGMAKGSGMIHPNMATMLGFITTDAAIEPSLLQKILKRNVELTFNMITVDGDTSTNDSLVVLANGLARNPMLENETSLGIAEFEEGLHYVMRYLAKEIARDGEGATKLVQVEVVNASTREDANMVAKAVAGSNLVKTAIFGEDANWGRILAAVGYSGADFSPELVDIYLGDVKVSENGAALNFHEDAAAQVLRGQEVTIRIDLKSGDKSAIAWTCDLTCDYIKINANYRT
mgnify:CR=1 FL=1